MQKVLLTLGSRPLSAFELSRVKFSALHDFWWLPVVDFSANGDAVRSESSGVVGTLWRAPVDVFPR